MVIVFKIKKRRIIIKNPELKEVVTPYHKDLVGTFLSNVGVIELRENFGDGYSYYLLNNGIINIIMVGEYKSKLYSDSSSLAQKIVLGYS